LTIINPPYNHELTIITELDDGKIYRKALYLLVKTMVSGSDFPLNQSNDINNPKTSRSTLIPARLAPSMPVMPIALWW